MALLIDCRPLATASARGGIGVYVHLLMAALAGRADVRRLVFAGDEAANDIVFGRRGHLLFLRDRLFLGEILRRHDIGLYHSPFYALPPQLAARTVLTVHDIIPHLFPAAVGLRNRMLFRHTYATARRADRVVVDSVWTAGELKRHFNVAPDRIRIIYPALPARAATAPAGMQMPPLGLQPGEYALCISNFHAHKNVAGLIAAYAQAGRQLPAPLVLAGFGAGREKPLKRHFAELVASGRVRFCGWLEQPQMDALLAGARILAVPSLAEGFGLPILEGFSAGVPVVAASFGAMAEIAGSAALLTDVREPQQLCAALVRLWHSPALAADLVGRGRERLKLFTPDSFRSAILAVYAELDC